MQYVAESPFDTRAFHISVTEEMERNFRLTTNDDGSAMLTRRKSNLSAVVHYKPLSEGSRDSKHPAIR